MSFSAVARARSTRRSSPLRISSTNRLAAVLTESLDLLAFTSVRPHRGGSAWKTVRAWSLLSVLTLLYWVGHAAAAIRGGRGSASVPLCVITRPDRSFVLAGRRHHGPSGSRCAPQPPRAGFGTRQFARAGLPDTGSQPLGVLQHDRPRRGPWCPPVVVRRLRATDAGAGHRTASGRPAPAGTPGPRHTTRRSPHSTPGRTANRRPPPEGIRPGAGPGRD